MPDFISEEDAAILARALNRRRFGLFSSVIDTCRALFLLHDKNPPAGERGDVLVKPCADECCDSIVPHTVQPDM